MRLFPASFRLLGAAALAIGLTACGAVSASSGHASFANATDIDADTTTDFDVSIAQENAPMVMQGRDQSTPTSVDVKYSITVKNLTTEPVRVRRIDLRSLGTTETPLDVATRNFNVTIAAGAEKKLEYWATLAATDSTIGSKAPTVMRIGISFEQGEAKRQEAFTRRVNGSTAVGIHS